MFEINSTYKHTDTSTALKNIISCFFFFTERFGGQFTLWWGWWWGRGFGLELKSLFLFLFLQSFKRWWGGGGGGNFFGGGGLIPGSREIFFGGGGGKPRVQGPVRQILGYANYLCLERQLSFVPIRQLFVSRRTLFAPKRE